MSTTPSPSTPPVTDNCAATPQLTFQVDGAANQYVVPKLICEPTLNYTAGQCAEIEAAYMANLISEVLNAGAGPVNVFPLLGVHNQGSLLDAAQNGYPLSGGTAADANVMSAFNVDAAFWESSQRGVNVVTGPAYLGYDFGTLKAWQEIGATGNAAERYQPPQPVRKQIKQLKIRQGISPTTRALQVRIEASDDLINWHRVDAVKLLDTDQEQTVPINSTAKYRAWRLIPIFFTGVANNSAWQVTQLQLLESHEISLTRVQDQFLLENRDRSYSRTGVLLRCTFDLVDSQTELARFGINLPEVWTFTTSFASMIAALGRPLVVGDILELPSQIQYDPNLRPVRKWLEVTDTAWSSEGYTFNWRPQLFKFYAQPINPSVEHRDILGLPQTKAAMSDQDFMNGDGFFGLNIQAHESSEFVQQEAKDMLPQTGTDMQNLHSNPHLDYGPVDLFAEDAIPPDGMQFTIGDKPPTTGLTDGAYHRQTFNSLPPNKRPPERLLRWSAENQRWSVMEVNSRTRPDSHKRTPAKILSSPNKTSINKKP